MNRMLTRAQELAGEMVAHRRYLHANPELGLDLPKTTAYVMEKLTAMGLKPQEICQSSVVATIGQGGKTILVRGDMDALPVKENGDLPFKSTNNNGHLCGHDLHTAGLLGVAKLLKEREAELEGTVKLMFQPGEETGSGAKAMIAAGLLENPQVDAAIALHVTPDMDPGKIGLKKGIFSASLDTFMVEVQGKGGHSSTPHLAVDPLMIVNTMYMMLNTLVGREVNPFDTVVLTIGKCGGGTVSNVIPDTAVLEGTLRCFDKDVRAQTVKRVYEIIEDVSKTLRGSYTVKKIFTDSVVNDDALCSAMQPYITDVVGTDNLIMLEKPMTGTEDFSYVSDRVPALMLWLGAGGKDNYSLHNPNVVFDESALPVGAAVLANCAFHWLKDNTG